MDLKLGEKVAIVTGAGRGIGRAVALKLADEGAYVVVNDIDTQVAEQVATEITSLGCYPLAITADVTKADQVDTMVGKVFDKFGKIDVLVNNAGVAYEPSNLPVGNEVIRKLFEESLREEWHRDIDLIMYGTLNCTKAVISLMTKQRSGRIVNIASDAGRGPSGGKRYSIYSAAKGGVIAFTRSLALEVASFGITVNTVSPGLVRTTKALLAEKVKETRPEEYEYQKKLERFFLETIPLGRIGEPDDIARAVVFLASDAASWITGQTLSVNGGQLMI